MRNKNIYRIIDANLNRAKEGLRVCEEITRFILNNRRFTAGLKGIRHEIDGIIKKVYPACALLKERNSNGDVGRLNFQGELKRSDYKDIYLANIQRVKESLRVLEEFSKLIDAMSALSFKHLRYKVYAIEKDSFRKISSLSDFR
ncbi:MAG: thiamine-phosphate pyrophosphorylase [Candidatus Omnitrophica bacterium]|nr:thiamine-phosphate pyrophosphorylase [Candidatus Omnitrophota bacterium]